MNGILLFIAGLGATEIIVIVVVILLLFGGRNLPALAKNLGSGIREFRKSMSGAAQDLSAEDSEEQTQAKPRSRKKKS